MRENKDYIHTHTLTRRSGTGGVRQEKDRWKKGEHWKEGRKSKTGHMKEQIKNKTGNKRT